MADSMEEFMVSRYAMAFGRVVVVILSCGFICLDGLRHGGSWPGLFTKI